MGIDLLTTIYPIRSTHRLSEICFCVEQNVALDVVDQIYIFAENFDRRSSIFNFLKHSKITLIDIDHRPTYRDFFSFAREKLSGRKVAVCNSDVYFDDTLAPALDTLEDNWLWCLCRHNILEDGSLELQSGGDQGSADAWLFVSPLKEFRDEIQIGVSGCDSYLAQKAADVGIKLSNPCRNVILRHVHRDDERNDQPNGMTYWAKPDYKCHIVYPTGLGISRSSSRVKPTAPGNIFAPQAEVMDVPDSRVVRGEAAATTGSPRHQFPPPPSSSKR